MQTFPTESVRSGALTVGRNGDPIPSTLRGAVVAIGNFDGLHLGHQALIGSARQAAEAQGSSAAILTFDPHPRSFFAPHASYFQLTSERTKLKILGRLGIDAAFIRRFDAALAATSASDFVSRLLKEELGAAGVVVGADFHFGRGREGTPDVLARLARENGIEVTTVGTVLVEGAPVSSSRIRAALGAGDVRLANALLGYRWLVEGDVRHGDKRGRTLGFPTANLSLGAGCGLANGIYAVRASTSSGSVHEGVASFGRRPTFDNGAPLLETYLFEFAGDLYGSRLEVEFVERIRAEERFASAEALVTQMRLDEAEARRILQRERDVETRSFIG